LTTTVTGTLLLIAVTRTKSASAAAESSMTAAGPRRYIGVIPSHLLSHRLVLTGQSVASHD
jgi:hypothetical protein